LSQISALKWRVEVIQGQSFYAHWKADKLLQRLCILGRYGAIEILLLLFIIMSPYSYFSLSSIRCEVICTRNDKKRVFLWLWCPENCPENSIFFSVMKIKISCAQACVDVSRHFTALVSCYCDNL